MSTVKSAAIDGAFKRMEDMIIALIKERDELLAVCEAQHRGMDWLFAKLISVTGRHEKNGEKLFLPSRSPVWITMKLANEAIKRAKGENS